VIGVLVGRLAVEAFRRVNFATTGLYPVASIATAALAFGAAESVHGSGFLSVYLAGLMLGSARVPGRRTVGDFHAGLAWVSQLALFLTLGLLVFPSQFGDIAGEALLIAAVLMFVARPLAALVATRVGNYPPREALLIGWAGLRGAVPIVLATFPVIEGVSGADQFFDLVFFVVLTSTLLQGTTFEPLARALGVTTSEPALGRPLIEVGLVRRLGAEVVEYPVQPGDAIAGRLVNELGLPREALVSIIVRGDDALLPRGSTQLEGGDRLHILVREPVRGEVEALFTHWRDGPIGFDRETPSPPVLGREAIFTVRPWRDRDGDPGDPKEVAGSAVVRTLRTRRGQAGALVQLADGRLAVTGQDAVAVGGSRRLFRYCRGRIRRAEDPQARAWWQEVAGVVSQRGLR
jgi:cell volume regulation protein A